MRKRPSKRRIWARFVRGDWVEEQDWWRYKLYKRNDGKPIVFNVYTFKYKRPAKDIGGK